MRRDAEPLHSFLGRGRLMTLPSLRRAAIGIFGLSVLKPSVFQQTSDH